MASKQVIKVHYCEMSSVSLVDVPNLAPVGSFDELTSIKRESAVVSKKSLKETQKWRHIMAINSELESMKESCEARVEKQHSD